MAFVVANRVRETTTTTGTGTITLGGAATGFQTFAAVGNGNSTYYTIAGQGTNEWEVGIGTYTASGTTLSRDLVLSSSAGGTTKVNFSSGTKDVFVDYPAEKAFLGFTTKTANYTAGNNEGILANTAGGAFTVTLPASPLAGWQVIVADDGANWGTNNLTVGRNGATINGLAENLVCDISGVSVQLVYDGTTWNVYAQVGGNGGTAVTLDGTQTLTNKTLTAPIVNTPIVTQNIQIISTNTAAVRSRTYVFTASLTLTLPASPAAGDMVMFANFSNTTTCVIARNGSNIEGLAEDMTVDNVNYFGTLVYADATRGWIFQ